MCGQPNKHVFSHLMFDYHPIFCWCLSYRMGICRRSPNFLGGVHWAPLLRIRGRVRHSRNTFLPHMCYHVVFGHPRSNQIDAGRRSQRFLGCLGPTLLGYGSLSRNMPLLCTCYCAKFGRSSSDGTSILTEFHWKSLDFAFHLSRSLKVVKIYYNVTDR